MYKSVINKVKNFFITEKVVYLHPQTQDNRDVAQLVAFTYGVREVAGSSPVIPTIFLIYFTKMFHRYIKIVLAVLLIAFAVYQFTLGKIGNGIFLILLAAFPILFYFRNEFLLLAFLRLRKQDMEGTKKWLDKIKNPETALIKKQRGYYNYLYGLIFYQINLTQAEKYFRTALKYGLNMNYDEAMARLSIAGILMQKRRKREAQEFLSQAKKLDKQNLLKDQIRMMQEQMKKI